MEFPILIAFFAYLFYLRNYVDHRTPAEKEEEKLAEGIALYQSGNLTQAFDYFNKRIEKDRNALMAYLYRGLCYKALGDYHAALGDFQGGISHNNTIPEFYIELGKLQKDHKLVNEALVSFERAIRVSRGQMPEPYHLRGLTLQLLSRPEEAADDFRIEAEIRQEEERAKIMNKNAVKPPLFDRKMVLNALMVIVTTAILVSVIKYASSIHLPYISAVLLSVAIGFAEPQRGWILAILQTVLLFVGYTCFTEAPESRARQELENFSLYGALSLIFAASYLGAFLKKAIDS